MHKILQKVFKEETNMKKLLAIVLALAMVLPMVFSAYADVPALEEKDDQELYDEILGEFYDMYMTALECMDVDQRYALEALAEAKMLEAGVLLPTTSNYGNYGIGRTVPKTANGTLWGNDSDRQYSLLVTKEMIKATDRDALKAMWMEAPDAATYISEAKAYLTENGYTLDDEYKYPSASDPQTWDALNTYLQADSRPLVQLYDGLMMYDVKNTQQPAIAESYEANDDMTVFTFKIRQGVKWVDSQGREIGEVTADDFVAGMQHMMDCSAGLEWLVDGTIVGASEYLSGETTDFGDVGVKALDDYTLEYTLCDPTPYFLTMLSYNIFAPMNRSYFLSQGGAFGIEEFAAAKESSNYKYGTSPDNIAYNGPFLVKSYTESNTIVFEANPSYYNPDILGVHTLTWKYDDGTDNTKTYKDMVAGDITNAGLNTATLEIAKADGLFDEYAYVSDTDATAFTEWMNVNRQAYANFNDANVAVSTMTEDQKTLANAAMRNVHFRRAVMYSIDRATMVAQRKGEDLKYNCMINAYVPGNFVYLSKEVTVDINGESVTFPAGTAYGTIRQRQLDADGSTMKTYDEETGLGTGFDGWYNPEAANAELAIAIEELAAQGYEISAENPVYLDIASFTGNDSFKNQDQALKQSVENVLGGVVIVNIVPCDTQKDWLNATYYPNTGAEMNFNIGNNGGWGPDYGDPKSYLDTLLPGGNGMTKSFGLF